MQRIIDGVLFEGKRVPDAWDITTRVVNGVFQRSARQVVVWEEVGPAGSPDGLPAGSLLLDSEERAKAEERAAAEAEERRLANLKKNAGRAKSMVSLVILSEAFDELLTLTYRENQTDLALCKAHFEKWYRRMKRALGGNFRFCASFEPQERGAWHVHVATHKLPKHAEYKGVKIEAWKLGTRIWRDIVGADNGLCFVGGKSKWGKGQRRRKLSLAKMAAYVSKYVTKMYKALPEEKNRYSRSNGTVIPAAHRMRLTGVPLSELIAVAFEHADGHDVVSHRVSRWGDFYWLCTEAPPVKPPQDRV
ncbi:MAG: hypothetical protein KF740_19420 [Ramlibacter sp.]|nr:hypothetical protein [Ramlibacter sp.]